MALHQNSSPANNIMITDLLKLFSVHFNEKTRVHIFEVEPIDAITSY